MKHSIKNMSDLQGGRIISTAPQKCETCEKDAAGANCVKLILAGSQHICVENEQSNNQ